MNETVCAKRFLTGHSSCAMHDTGQITKLLVVYVSVFVAVYVTA